MVEFSKAINYQPQLRYTHGLDFVVFKDIFRRKLNKIVMNIIQIVIIESATMNIKVDLRMMT